MAKIELTSEWLRNLPNKLTLGRIAVIPLLLALYPLGLMFAPWLRVVCALLFAAASFTDWLDGYLARKYGNVTPLGSLLDPIADKMLIASALVLLASGGAAPSFVAALLIARDIAVNGIRLLANEQGFKIEVRELGKWKTTFTLVAIGCLFVNDIHFLGFPWWREVGMVCLWGSLILSVWSAWQYGRGYLEKAKVSL